ncbi:TPA: ABC transporter permease [Streptococcus pyogenes]|nr:amino acid ABC transporter permease [Streptococcus pyogenes]VGQ59128.1 amino acid ABC transporter permease [Streptococcus pyogenes]VGU87845.1 amino acid ABC transporter permease [Streptococcus pyogenes]VHB19089.1 amino acid ABC transporter permease [Streptococcus pyogenes]VHB55580.1 amino acid ABC transporter permease [Streptococcus pyogenes]
MTYKNMLLGKIRYLILFLVAIQSVLFALMAIFFTGVQYQESWQNYNRNSSTVTVYLQKLSDEQSQSVFRYFLEQNNLSIWTRRFETSEKGEGLSRIYVDILGNSEGFSDVVNTSKVVISRTQFKTLLEHDDNSLTIGLDKGSNNMLYELPSLLFTTPVVIDRLDYVFQKTNTINGTYYINGIKDRETEDDFLLGLSEITGITTDELTRESFGSSTDHGIWPIALAISIIVNSLIILVLLLICVLQSFKHFGILILLGWDRKALWNALFKKFLLFSIYITPVSASVLWLLSGWFSFGLPALFPIFAGTSLSILVLCLILIIPSIIVYLVSPLAAIHKRLPMKPLMVISLIFYVLVGVLLIAVSHSLDAPMNQFVDNIKVAREWKSVEDMYVISDFVEGNDIGIYSGTTNSLERDMYSFYQSISDLPGVYIAQGEYLDNQYLNTVQGTYQNVPSRPFWYLTYSYNYLSDFGVDLSEDELSEIKGGTRLYLIPETLSTAEIEVMKGYLQEIVTVKSGDIETRFTKNPTFLFKTYQPSNSIFTWSTSIANGVTSKEPTIFVASPENLYFMETANLFVSGYNGFLKFRDEKVMNQVKSILKNDFTNLSDNKLRFKTVKNYINGLQKNLSYTFYLFGSIIIIIVVTLIAIFWSFILVYQLLFEEKLYVQYFMGFSPWKRYILVISLIIGVSIIELLTSIILGSKLGIVLTLITTTFQMFFLYFNVFRKERGSILQSFKG